MLKKYNNIIKELKRNDRNSNFDEILLECGDITDAIVVLKECLKRLVEEEGFEGEELAFYEKMLEKANTL